MDQVLHRDLEHFFRVFLNRTEGLTKDLSVKQREELEDEISLLRQSVFNRLDEYFRQE